MHQNQYDYGPMASPPPQRPNKSSGNVVLGVIIVGLVAVLIFSAISGLIFLLCADRRAVPETTDPMSTHAVVVDPTETDPSNTPPVTTPVPMRPSEGTLHDPSYALPDIAPPAHVDGKEVLTIPEIVEKTKPAVVAIFTNVIVEHQFGGLSQNTVAGSGFIISDDGYIVTNAHVVKGARSIHVNLEDGRTFEAELVGADSYADVAVIKIQGNDLPFVALGDSDRVRVGELVIAIGNPTGKLSGTVTFGIVSAVDRDLPESPIPLIQTDAALNSGNSGGALINQYGEVIGINQLKIVYADPGAQEPVLGISFAIPSTRAKPIIESIVRTGEHVWPMLGVSVMTVQKELAEQQDLHYPGVVIVSIARGSGASQAGLSVGDVITSFNGHTVTTTQELREQKDACKAGDEVTLTVFRGERAYEVRVTLGGSS